MPRAIITVHVRGRDQDGEERTRGQDVSVTANGYMLPVRGMTLTVKDRKATAILEIDVDELVITDKVAEFVDLKDREQIAKFVEEGYEQDEIATAIRNCEHKKWRTT